VQSSGSKAARRTCALPVAARALEVSAPDALAGRRDVRPCLIAHGALLENLLHRCPIGHSPAMAVAVVALRGNPDLGKLQPGAGLDRFEVKNRNGVVIRPPIPSPPGLHDLLPGLQCQVETGNVGTPGGKAAADLPADLGRLAGQ